MQTRATLFEDLSVVCGFAVDADELYYSFPKAKFPLTVDQVLPNFNGRLGNTSVICDGKVVAFANYISVLPNDSVTVGNVLVDPSFRGKGVGRFLIEYMENFAIRNFEARLCKIPCFNRNTSGLLFYHALGYRPIDGEPRVDFQNSPVYLVHLAKALKATV